MTADMLGLAIKISFYITANIGPPPSLTTNPILISERRIFLAEVRDLMATSSVGALLSPPRQIYRRLPCGLRPKSMWKL